MCLLISNPICPILVDHVQAFNRARRTRDLLLAVPDRLAPILAAVADPTECHRIMTEEITRACEELSRVASQ